MALCKFRRLCTGRRYRNLHYINQRWMLCQGEADEEAAAVHDANVDIIDLDEYDSNFSELSQRVIRGLETSGFVSLRNVAGLDTQALHCLSQTFFSKDISYKLKYAKHKWNAQNTNRYRGYYPILPGQSSMKEAIEFGRGPSHVPDGVFPSFPLYESPPFPDIKDWGQTFDDQFEVLLQTATKMMQLIAYGLYSDTKEDAMHCFESMFMPYTLSTFRLMHSPSHPLHEDDPSTKRVVTSTPDHIDSGFITLVITFNRGLELFNQMEERWERLPIGGGVEGDKYGNHLVHINIGRVLRNMTDQRLMATRHRVINYGENRHSIAFFFEPNHNAQIPVTETVTRDYGPYLVEVDQQFIEYSDEDVGYCWVDSQGTVQCVDAKGRAIDYRHDDGLYEKFRTGNEQ